MVHFDRIKGAKLSNSFDVRNLNREKGSEERLGILAISLFLLLTRDCHAQLRETFTTYESSYFHTTHDIDIVARDLDHYELHIRLMSYDMLNLEGGIQVSLSSTSSLFPLSKQQSKILKIGCKESKQLINQT